MKKPYSISISYPPLLSDKGTAFLSQNRQFQWTNTNNIIYPVIPAYAATLLKKNNYKVYWDDAIAENIDFDDWLKRLIKRKPNLICIETKTPVIKQHWEIIKQIKKNSSSTWKPKIVLMGDHVTALPQESLKNSKVDYVITGGDYDFMIFNLVEHLNKSSPLEPGFWYKNKKEILNTGLFGLKHHNLDNLPIIDRDLTKWQLYAYDNTNYKYKPGAYIMSGRDCWWGKCSFCSWTTLYPGNSFRCFSVQHAVDEIENLVNKYQVKEIFDDSGTFPVGDWLQKFCEELIKRGLNKKVRFGCNMRFGALNQDQYLLLRKAGFRFILYGFESANQKSLNKINKNNKVENAQKTLEIAKKAGIEPHITVMIGYPWETKKDALRSLSMAKTFFQKGLADSLQATIVIPYPGTSLFEECKKENLLTTQDWEKYDMRQSVMKSPISSDEQIILVQNIFKGILTPKFIIRKIISIRSLDDIKHLLNYSTKYIKKLKDFQNIK